MRDRRQGVLRQRDGKYPEMELKLAVNVEYLMEIGLYVDKHVIKLEVRTIFHDLNPHKYPSPLVGEYDPDNT